MLRAFALALALAFAAAAPAQAPKPLTVIDPAADDLKLALDVADALREAKIGGVQIQARAGRVVLKGALADAKAVARAVDIAKHVAGVKEIEDRLVAAEHD
jgi:osmotically-inducible protein OsmY